MRDAGWGTAPARPPPPPPPPVCPREGSRRRRRLGLCLRRRLGPAPAMAQILPIRFQEHFQVRPGLRRRGWAGFRGRVARSVLSAAPPAAPPPRLPGDRAGDAARPAAQTPAQALDPDPDSRGRRRGRARAGAGGRRERLAGGAGRRDPLSGGDGRALRALGPRPRSRRACWERGVGAPPDRRAGHPDCSASSATLEPVPEPDALSPPLHPSI